MSKTSRKSNSEEIICLSCGGSFSILEAKCPYCGTMNPTGAEMEYMRKLQGIRGATEKLTDDVEDEVEEGLKTNSKRVVKFLVKALVAILAIIALGTFLANRGNDDNLNDYKDREEFRKAYFDELDQLYEAGKDEELLDLALELIEEPGHSAIYDWVHYGYLEKHDTYRDLMEWKELYQASGNINDLTYAVYAALILTRDVDDLSSSYKYRYSDGDLEKIEEYSSYAEDYLETTLNMTKKDLDALVDELKGDRGYITRTKLREYLNENI